MMDRRVIHEAGHAVAWTVLGRPIDYVEITLGRAGPDLRDGATQPVPGTALGLEDEILAALAGWSAELVWFGDDDEARTNAELNRGYGDDEAAAEAYLRKLGYHDPEDLSTALENRWAKSRSLCQQHWALILAVAEELWERSSLSGAEIKSIADSLRTKEAP